MMGSLLNIDVRIIYYIVSISLLLVFLILVLMHVFILLFQEKLVVRPEKLSKTYQFSFDTEFEEINLKTTDGVLLNSLLFKVNNPKGVVVYFHPFSGNILFCERTAGVMTKQGYDVFVMDYRGFGKSEGKLTEYLTHKDAVLGYEYVLKHYDNNIITVYGRGIGATFATYIAFLYNPKQLIIESPLYNFVYEAKLYNKYIFLLKYITKYKFDTASYLIHVKCKTYLFHGKKSTVVKYTNSVKLNNLIKNGDLTLINDGTYYNLQNHDVYLDKMKEILAN